MTLLLFTLFPLLIACNGSNSSVKIITITETPKLAQATELLLLSPSNKISDIFWQQTAGDPVTFLAYTSKVIAFTPIKSGDYSFSVSFTLENGTKKLLNHSITVSNEKSQISARLSHAVLEGNKVSLRAAIADNLSEINLVWQQISGPEIKFTVENTDGNSVVYFNAPDVTKDTLLEFSVSVGNHKDTVAVIVENAVTIDENSSNTAYTERLARVFPFIAKSPYAETLVDCVYSNTLAFDNTCSFVTLPLIAHDTTTPTVDDIMARVVVSHHWMGENFRDFLENHDPDNDFKNLFRATTAIVISYDVRPSYYWVVSGAIHLDANYLWLTANERDTINEASDYRASFGNDLRFSMPWRYVKNNNYTTTYIPDNVRVTRQPEDILYGLSSLLYHELAHANDFFPASSWKSLNKNDGILAVAQRISDSTGFKSDQLQNTLPLLGAEMYALAQVRFHGSEATTLQKSYMPSDVSVFFNPESAPQFYNYSSIRENYAMLFDGFMMKTRYNISRDVAVTNSPRSTSEPYIVNWGQRGRIGEESIKPRVLYSVSNILPEIDNIESLVANLPAPILMNAGQSWKENIGISPVINEQAKQLLGSKAPKKINEQRFIQQLFYEKPSPLK
jgi:hypothetical protein